MSDARAKRAPEASNTPKASNNSNNSGVSIGISRRYGLFKKVVVAAGRLLVGFRVHGAERVPRSGPLIIASNHRRYLDPVYVSMAVPRRLQWMGKKELFVPPLDRLFYFIGCFPVDRKGGGRGALRTALGYLQEGAALGIFPEGTRRGKIRREAKRQTGERSGGGKVAGDETEKEAPKNGVVMLASRSGAAVVPVHVGPVPNPLQRLRGGRLEVYVGEPRLLGSDASGKASEKGGRRGYGEAAEGLVRDIYALPEMIKDPANPTNSADYADSEDAEDAAGAGEAGRAGQVR